MWAPRVLEEHKLCRLLVERDVAPRAAIPLIVEQRRCDEELVVADRELVAQKAAGEGVAEGVEHILEYEGVIL